MKKIITGIVAVMIAATSFAGTASADHRHKKWHGTHYSNGYKKREKRHQRRVYVERETCVVRTYRRLNSNGDVVIDRVRTCR